MSEPGLGRFLTLAIAIALAAGAATLPFSVPRGAQVVAWSLAGWLMMSVIGVTSGFWMVRKHGAPGSGFLAAVGAGMLARLLAASAGAAVVAQQELVTVWAYLGGLFTGYLPLQVFEVTWFARRAGTRS